MSSQAALLEKKQPPPWVKQVQMATGSTKLVLGVGSLVYLLLALRNCNPHYIAWFIFFVDVTVIDGLEVLLSRFLPHIGSDRAKASIGCCILWTSWLLSLSYIALLVWGAVMLSWRLDTDCRGVWGVQVALVVLCGVHSVYTVMFTCMPLCCMCCPLLGAVNSTQQRESP